MSAPLFDRSRDQVIAADGRKAAGAKIYFFNAGTSTPRTTYSDSALSAPRTHPVIADANGLIPAIYLQWGDYRVRVETSTGVVISDDDNVAFPAPADAGGGGGIVVSTADIIQTGFVIWRPFGGTLGGFVPLNGETIGSATSGATGRANADALPLYTLIYDNVDDAYCAVSGGRGANAAADFAANKPLALPDARGRTLFGLDTMGASAAGTMQVTVDLTTTNGLTSGTVASRSGLAIGMYVSHPNVAAGTRLIEIAGTTVTLSAPATASGTASGRFSVFQDAQEIGAKGGTATHQLIQRELSSAIGTAATTLTPSTLFLRGGAAAQSGAGLQGAASLDSLSAITTIENALGDYPHTNTPPGLMGTWFIRL